MPQGGSRRNFTSDGQTVLGPETGQSTDLARSGKGLARRGGAEPRHIAGAAEDRTASRIDDCTAAAGAAEATPLWRGRALPHERGALQHMMFVMTSYGVIP